MRIGGRRRRLQEKPGRRSLTRACACPTPAKCLICAIRGRTERGVLQSDCRRRSLLG
jgi:hypothetical protein